MCLWCSTRSKTPRNLAAPQPPPTRHAAAHCSRGLSARPPTLCSQACLNNDFATYKRAFQFCRGDIPNAEQITQENNLLQPFLANRESLILALKAAVDKVSERRPLAWPPRS